jgi:hypothetical protein
MEETIKSDISRYSQIIFENTEDVIWVLDLATFAFTFVSPSVFRLRGYTPEEVAKQTLQDILTFESYQMVVPTLPERLAMFEAGDNSVKVQVHEVDQTCKDGSIISTEVVTTLIPNPEGKVIEIIGVTRNIEVRKKLLRQLHEKTIDYISLNEQYLLTIEGLQQMNDDLAALNKQLAESEEQFRLAFDTSPDSISISRLDDGEYIKVNDGFCQLTGYTPQEVIGQTAEKLNIWMDSNDRNKFLQLLLQVGIVKNMEVIFRFKNGIVHTGLISGNIIVLNGKKHLLAITRDIEEIKKTQEELIKAKEKAQEADRLKSVFLQNMSHEIRTPMNAIMGFANLIPSYFDEKDKMLEFSQIINQRAADLLEIINDILDFSKIETGQLPVHTEPCDLNDMFTELKELFINHKKKIEKDGIDLIIYPECFPGQQIVITDTVKLKQIFINLIYNAFKFTTQGKIEVGCQLDDSERLMFFVSDTGIGIPPEKQSIIFDRFRQVNEINNPHGGSGLGLAIVKGLVELLGGNINVESSPDKGTKFTFSIHYTLTDNILSKENQTEEEKLCVSSHSILIVEDDKYSGLYIEEILADSGLKIYLADTGKKAVDIALNNHVDIILMDIRLPEMEGYEATRIIKEKCPHVKIIAQTAYATHSDRIKAFDAGCDDYLSKPVSKQLLLTKINFFLHELASEN